MRRLKTDDRFLDWIDSLAADVANAARLCEELYRQPSDAGSQALAQSERDVESGALAIAQALQDTFAAPVDPEDLLALSTGLEMITESVARGVRLLVESANGRVPNHAAQLLSAAVSAATFVAESAQLVSEPRSLLARLGAFTQHQREVRASYDRLVTSLVEEGQDAVSALRWTYVADQFLKTLAGYQRAASALERIAVKYA